MDKEQIINMMNQSIASMVMLKEMSRDARSRGDTRSEQLLDNAFLNLRNPFMALAAEACGVDPGFSLTVPAAIWPASNRCVNRIGDALIGDGGLEQWKRTTNFFVRVQSGSPGFNAVPIAVIAICSAVVATVAAATVYKSFDTRALESANQLALQYLQSGGTPEGLKAFMRSGDGGFFGLSGALGSFINGVVIVGVIYIAATTLPKFFGGERR